MIPHITQERRMEKNVHHTGGIAQRAIDEEMEWETVPSLAD